MYPEFIKSEVTIYAQDLFKWNRLHICDAFSYNTAILDASLAAVCLYEHRGYKTIRHGVFYLENEVKLVYEIMEKKLNKIG